jgi:hypothetical protein
MSNTTLIERIECAEDMAKYTGKYDIPAMAKAMLVSGKVVKAHKFLKRVGF